MIHDALLSCLNLSSNTLTINTLIETEVIVKFLHPSEKKILEDILNIVNLLREIKKYADLSLSSIAFEESYFNAFSCGLNDILHDYIADITTLELEHLEKSNHSLLFIYEKLRYYEPLALFFNKLISKITLENVSGCRMVQFLHQNFHHGDRRIYNALKHIHKKANIVFLKQLSNWILYAKTVDKCDEFFIQNSNLSINVPLEADKESTCTSLESDMQPNQDDQDTDIWDYEIFSNLLPKCFNMGWAEKVLFIGQTVLLFETESKEVSYLKHEGNLWNRQEHKFLKKIQDLQNNDEINIVHYENTIDEIKSYVVNRLSAIAINQAQLKMQLQIIKEYFLLARGELFLEFIRKVLIFSFCGSFEKLILDVLKIFELSANSVGATGLEQISIEVPTKFNEDGNNEGYFNVLNEIQLSFKIKWPLQLLFSPKVMERYNIVFRFLLRIKKIQYQLHLIWRNQIQKAKREKQRTSKYMQLHSLLMFFIDNFQYYIQVDVLESQFNLLINSLHKDVDFEKIQRAHAVFLSNVFSLCFLFEEEDENNISDLPSCGILQVLPNLFDTAENFCNLIITETTKTDNERKLNEIKMRLQTTFDTILKICMDSSISQNVSPLTQFLLRLDFNHWFSSRKYSHL